MANYVIGWQPWETEFNGDKVTMQVRPLKRWAMQQVAPLMVAAARLESNEDNAAGAADLTFKIQSECLEILKQHVKDISGFEINGEQPTVDILTEESVFAGLCTEIISRLVIISQLSRDDEKN